MFSNLCFKKNNQNLISVVLKSDGDELYADIHKLLNYGFNNFEKTTICNKNQFVDNIPIIDGEHEFAAGITKENLVLTIPKGSNDKIEKKIKIDEEIYAPIEKNQILGEIEYYLNDELLGKADIVSTLDIDKIPDKTIKDTFLDKWYIFLLIVIFLLWINSNINRRQRRKRRKSLYESKNY